MAVDADSLRLEGNELLKNKDLLGAISKYSVALDLSPNDHVLYSNRSAAYLIQGMVLVFYFA